MLPAVWLLPIVLGHFCINGPCASISFALILLKCKVNSRKWVPLNVPNNHQLHVIACFQLNLKAVNGPYLTSSRGGFCLGSAGFAIRALVMSSLLVMNSLLAPGQLVGGGCPPDSGCPHLAMAIAWYPHLAIAWYPHLAIELPIWRRGLVIGQLLPPP